MTISNEDLLRVAGVILIALGIVALYVKVRMPTNAKYDLPTDWELIQNKKGEWAARHNIGGFLRKYNGANPFIKLDDELDLINRYDRIIAAFPTQVHAKKAVKTYEDRVCKQRVNYEQRKFEN